MTQYRPSNPGKQPLKPRTSSISDNPPISLDLARIRLDKLNSRAAGIRHVVASIRDEAQIGICTDLCSERERYKRWIQQDLSVFEFDQKGRMCENRCLKGTLKHLIGKFNFLIETPTNQKA